MIFIADTHSLRPIFELIDLNNITKSNLIHVGDSGIGFISEEQQIKNLLTLDLMLRETNNMLYMIRGNHNEKKYWEESKFKDSLPKFTNLILIPDMSVLTIENKNILFNGGGISIDRKYRLKNGYGFDPNEGFLYNKEHMLNVINNQEIDIVVTHSCPHFCEPISLTPIVYEFAYSDPTLIEELKAERLLHTQMFTDLLEVTKPKHWLFGHMHRSSLTEQEGCKFRGLAINELYELK